MTSRKSGGHQHGLVDNKRPKSKLRKRRNKTLANQRKEVLRKITRINLTDPEKAIATNPKKKNTTKLKGSTKAS